MLPGKTDTTSGYSYGGVGEEWTEILICGDWSTNKIETIIGGNYLSSPKLIRLPAKWDEMTAKLGYLPLGSFYL